MAIILALGSVGVLLMARGASRASYGGPVSGTRYTVTTDLGSDPSGRVVACYGWLLSLPPPVCGGVPVTNVDFAAISGTHKYSNGVAEAPTLTLVGTWDGHALRLTEPPRATKIKGTDPQPVPQAPPPSSGKPAAQMFEELRRDNEGLKQRGIILLQWGQGADGVEVVLAVPDPKAVQYLYDTYGHMLIKGWLQPLSLPLPTPTIVEKSPIAMPSAAQLSAPSANVVWVMDAAGLYRSIDRGNAWEQRPTPKFSPREITFIDDKQGWGLFPITASTDCASDGSVLWRMDGGAGWSQLNATGIALDKCKAGLTFVDSMHGFLGAWDDSHQPTIYRSADGGNSWVGSSLADPPDFKTHAGGFSLHSGWVKRFGNTLYLMAWGRQEGDMPNRQYLYRSTDGGATWSWLMKIPSRYTVMVTESRWLQLVVPGQSTETINSGQQWHPYESDFTTDTPVGGPQVVFADAQVGYAEGRGALQRTDDGGAHWTRIVTPGILAPSPSPPTVASSARTNPSPVALLPVTDPGFTCRLPVTTGGFVALPGGAFTRDPAASMVTGPQWVQTTTQPVLKGSGGLAFDLPLFRWVPANPEVISRDGSHYAWTEFQTATLHVTKVADGTDRSFAAGPPQPQDPDLRGHYASIPVPIGITTDSVLLTYGGEGLWGVWRLDLASGLLTKVTGMKSPSYGAGAIWLELTRGPNHVGMYSDGDTLTRLDLNSGAVQDWFHRDNLVVRNLGFDRDGNPWVQVIFENYSGGGPVEIWRVRGPGQADLIHSGQRVSRVIADKPGTWFANESGVYLYSGGRVQRVSSASVGELVGPCI
jgi:hypothetical protein